MQLFARIWLISTLVIIYGLIGWFLVLLWPFIWIGPLLAVFVALTILSVVYFDGGKR
jgi:hypothetical protein